MMLDSVIGAIGSPDFGKVLFAALHDDMAARQVVVHRFHEGAPVEPLIQESAETGDWVRTLVKRYVGGDSPTILSAPCWKCHASARSVCLR